MSGVRNLRAMFEQKGDKVETTSPPDRGRSPGIPPSKLFPLVWSDELLRHWPRVCTSLQAMQSPVQFLGLPLFPLPTPCFGHQTDITALN